MFRAKIPIAIEYKSITLSCLNLNHATNRIVKNTKALTSNKEPILLPPCFRNHLFHLRVPVTHLIF
jgi:hypothetical protein